MIFFFSADGPGVADQISILGMEFYCIFHMIFFPLASVVGSEAKQKSLQTEFYSDFS